jgi:DNA mismatch repair protein MutS2
VQVSFSISQKTLERLEWPEILARLAERARTPLARSAILAGGLFAGDAAGVATALQETREAHAILESGDAPPLGGVGELSESLARSRKGGGLAPAELLEVASSLCAIQDTVRFLGRRAEESPRLGEVAETIAPQAVLRAEIESSIDTAGEVRDEASQALAQARRDVRRLGSEIQDRLRSLLRDPSVKGSLSDSYFTVRNDRYVLPVRADARGSVRGIVHDASRTGTTIFMEPEALVELNNRHKRAELSVEQETLRVLRNLSQAVADGADEIEAALATLAHLDLAFARAHLSRELDGVEPELGSEGILSLPQLRHPLIAEGEAVPNDLRLGEDFSVLVLSGPNAGGKTVTLKSAALAVLLARAGIFVPAAAPARVDLFESVLADIGDEQDIHEHLSTFSAHMANLAEILANAGRHSLVVLDEVGMGTDPGEGAAIAQATLESLADAGARVVTTTHYNLLKEMAEVDERFANASVEFDPATLAPSYRLRFGLPGTSSARTVAARMGLHRQVLDRADEILGGEERRLDGMLSQLSASRVALAQEQRQARRLAADSDAVRSRYTRKLERLGERREELYRSMRRDLDAAFREAHDQVAAVVRDLQRGGTAQQAERARQSLLEIEKRARAEQPEAPAEPRSTRDVDWKCARPGDTVVVQGGRAATLLSLPDRRGRVSVGLGSARVLLPMERVAAPDSGTPEPAREQGRVRAPIETTGELPDTSGNGECDLRGMRADEAVDRLIEALDRAASAGCNELRVIHGVGTGALRRAVREHLARSAYVERFLPGAAQEGGDGVTTAYLGS